MISNFHTHLKLCNHANGMSEDYVKKAIENNFLALGISDHAPLPSYNVTKDEYLAMYMNENMTLNEFYNVYLNDIKMVKEKYKNITILKGIETEYIDEFKEFYKKLSENLDYMILGEHFFEHNGRIIDTYKRLNGELAISYANNIKKALDTKMFKILAHPDLFMYDYKNLEFDDDAINASKIILEACEKNNVLVEINARGMKYVGKNGIYLYPRIEFFELAKQYNVEFIIGLDAHDPSEISEDNIKKASDFCKSLGINAINL